MALKQIDLKRQSLDGSLNFEKLEADFLNGSDLDVTNGNRNATITGLSTPVNISDAVPKDYVDGLIDKSLKTPEAYDPTTTGNYPTTYGGNPIEAGDSFRITSAQADIGGDGVRDVNVEDLLIALIDLAGATTSSNWMVAESNRTQATETSLGVLELATQGEVTTGTDDLRAVTPLKLATWWGTVVTTAGAGITDNANTFDIVATDLSINVNANDLGVNIGTTNGTSLEVSANGLELTANVTGERTFTVGAGNNFDIVADMNLATLSNTPDGTVPLAIATVGYITSSSSTPNKESHTLTAGEIGGGSFTLAQTPIANSTHIVFGGAEQAEGATKQYTISGNTVTLVTPADWSANDVLEIQYLY